MKLLRYGAKGQEQPGLLDRDGRIRSLAGVVADIAGSALTREGLPGIRGMAEKERGPKLPTGTEKVVRSRSHHRNNKPLSGPTIKRVFNSPCPVLRNGM